ncbi:MAG TPA: uroporphyrinogen-III C-methyltransferase [Thermodesulfovibrionia bacterium]|nr:uroporphyrinogen-III C-methyltransferase [Thermodesulfovibrionia bacterium]
MSGKVYVVGAGPGDIGLLTVKGMICIGMADVIVYDFHINAQFLNYAKESAEFIYAGKRGGHHALEQEEINEVLIQKAKEGKIVCRLKGGDPFVFGRGGEEVLALKAEGIEFEIVPGISSAVAAPAYAGIPLTHREYSSSAAVITGCESDTKEKSCIKWDKIATGVDTLVFLMAVKNIGCIAENLISHGKAPDTPVAVIRWGTRPEQKVITGTLSTIEDQIKAKHIRPPSVVVVGEVVKLRDSLKWYELKPLFGHRVLVTRRHSEGFEILARLGAEILEFPTIEIVPPQSYDELDQAIGQIETYNWLIFTSAAAVKNFFARFRELKKDVRDLKGIQICCIGPATASEVESFGMNVDMIPDEFNAEGLTALFPRVQGVKFLLPRAEVAREVFPKKIMELGGIIDVPAAYRVAKPSAILGKAKRMKRFLEEGKITVATFTSVSTFHNFMDLLGNKMDGLLENVLIAAIGPVTAKAIEQAGFKVHIIPPHATIGAMVQSIIETLTDKKMSEPGSKIKVS